MAVTLGPREEQIAALLLQGYENKDIAAELKMAKRTVKAHFNRMFLRFSITGGIKRVKLATLLYRREVCLQAGKDMAVTESFPTVSARLSNSLPLDLKTKRLLRQSAPLSTLPRTTSESSTTS